MSDSENETSSAGARIRPFKTSKDYPLWSKRIVNHLMGAGLLNAIAPGTEYDDDANVDKNASTSLSKSSDTSVTSAEPLVSKTVAKPVRSNSSVNRKAYTYIYARLHDDVLSELSPEVSDPFKPDAKALWDELKSRYGGGAMHELVSTIDIILSTRIEDNETPRDKLTDMRSAFLKLNANNVPLDDKFFALLVLKSLPESYSATVQVLFSQPDLSSDKVITSACNYWDLKTKTKDDESSVALAARRNMNKNANRTYVNPNPPGTFHCTYHPWANSHNTADCRVAKHSSKDKDGQSRSGNAATANIATTDDMMSFATAYIAHKTVDNQSVEFHLDSGASDHLTCNKDLLLDPIAYRSAVTIGDGSKLYSTHRGTMQVNQLIKVDNVLYVPNLSCNLLSVRQLLSGNFQVKFSRDEAIITDAKQESVLGTANFERQNGTYTLRASPSSSQAMLVTSTDYVLNWHNRLGHLNVGEVVRLGKAGLLDKDWDSRCTYANINSDDHVCEPCILGKGARMPSPRSFKRATNSNQLVHIDLWGPARTPTVNGARYLLTCHDDYSRRTQIFFLKKKSDALAAFADYIKLVENHCQTRIKTVRMDNGGEFTSTRFGALLAVNGIEAMPIPADAHAQNGRIERQHLTIFNTVRTLLVSSNLPERFWGEAAAYAVHLRNHLPLSNSLETPMSLWTGKPGRALTTFQPFGSTIYIRDHKQTNKLKPRYVKALLLGWRPLSDSIVKFWHRETNTFGYSRDVVHGLPDGSYPAKAKTINAASPPPTAPIETTSVEEPAAPESMTPADPLVSGDTGAGEYDEQEKEDQDEIDEALTTVDSQMDPPLELPESPPQPIAPKKPKPKDGKGYHYVTVAVDQDKDPHDELTEHVPTSFIDPNGRRIMTRRNKTLLAATTVHQEVNDGSHIVIRRIALLARADTQNPNTYLQARRSSDWPEWEKAIIEELRKMDKYEVWEIVLRTSDMRTLKAKWVFTRKIDGTTGLPSTFKARWVAKGFNQIEGVDFNEIFSSVAHKDSIRVFLTLVNFFDLECDQVDIVAAFLNGELEETIYMEPPEGSNIPAGYVLRLKKSLYGLKQSPRCFNVALDEYLRSEGFRPNQADPCLYMYSKGKDFMMLAVHVDDQLIASNNRAILDAFKRRLNERFECKDQGPVSYFLGFNVIRDRKERLLSISQEHYLEQLLRKFGMEKSHGARVALPSTFKPVPATDAEFDDAKHLDYPQIIGSVMYAATISRPDLSYAAGVLARFIGKWSMTHYQAAKHLLRYIRGTTDLCLTFDAEAGKRVILGYADADWGGCLDTRRSTTGYLFKTFGGLVAWKSRRQPTVALSTAEAEIMASVDAAKQAVWLKKLLSDLNISIDVPVQIHNDNMGAIHLSQHPGSHDRTKHIDMRHLWLREKVVDGTVEMKHVPTNDNVADTLTKPLPVIKTEPFNHSLGLRRVPLQ
jgi:hypothetical protein